MKRIFFVLACLVSATCHAADLDQFGMSGIEPLTDMEATEVRGAGVDTFVSSLATQSFNFALADRDSGSVFNMNSNAQMVAFFVDMAHASHGLAQTMKGACLRP